MGKTKDAAAIAEAAYFNQLAACWDEMRELHEEKINMLVEMLGVGQEDTVLDLGSGTGVLLPYLSPLAKTVTAVDFAAEMLAQAKKKFEELDNVSFVVANVLTYESKQCFDKITCMNFYPHIKEKEIFVERMNRLLKPGGEITIFHDISRQKVNNIHRESKEVANDRLKLPEQEALPFLARGFSLKKIIDNDDYYFLQLKMKN